MVPSRCRRDGDRELRNAVQKVGGAVERIDDPGVGLVGAGRACRLPRRGSRSRAAPSSVRSRRMSSARRSAAVTKFAGPFSETCSFSTSPKSRLRLRAALRAAAVMTFIRAERIMDWALRSNPGVMCAAIAARVKSGARSRFEIRCHGFAAASPRRACRRAAC